MSIRPRRRNFVFVLNPEMTGVINLRLRSPHGDIGCTATRCQRGSSSRQSRERTPLYTTPQTMTHAEGADDTFTSACVICGKDGQKEEEQEEEVKRDSTHSERAAPPATSALPGLRESSPSTTAPPSFALRCNSCRCWYHPWCMGYQLDLDRSCLVTAADVDIPVDAATRLPLVCQWFCDSCASTETGVVAATGKRRGAPGKVKVVNGRDVIEGTINSSTSASISSKSRSVSSLA